ncbi:hypothetical protein P872_19550 [Rhodonellum psychrophilum GCM71 = DSM 17998]|uniref:Uncharacterized protein n=1 Tax=Rhodonellum psychrophilum GCM71 = DSM 17998 TaxID=1123057 RepID=U5BVV8_9BACT|nr:hypothetical protein P872_19550 [Rhodonellum psychrophilum GCM71 = DSM 17998]
MDIALKRKHALGFPIGLRLHENQIIWRIMHVFKKLKSKHQTRTDYQSISGWNRIGHAELG